jgi:hypothetical protein
MHEWDLPGALTTGEPRFGLASGILETVQRRSMGIEFMPIPGCRVRLGAVCVRDRKAPHPVLRWSDVVSPAGSPYTFFVIEGDVAEHFLRGQCAIPPERLLVRSPDRFTDPVEMFSVEYLHARDKRILLAATEDVCRYAIPTLNALPELAEGYEAVEVVGDPHEFPTYPVCMAWQTQLGEWGKLLVEAQERELFGNSTHRTALLYANLIATAYLRPFEGMIVYGGRAHWDGPLAERSAKQTREGGLARSPVAHMEQAGEPFQEALCRHLAATLIVGLTAQLAARMEAGAPEENHVRIIEQIQRDVSQLVPDAWAPRFLSALERIAKGTGWGPHASAERPGPPRVDCLSCSAFLSDGLHGGVSDRYCRFCSDERGQLKPREEVEDLLARWIRQWQQWLPVKQSKERAAAFMEKMPAWGGD